MAQEFRIASLDGLRGIAASAVVFSHLPFFYPAMQGWMKVSVGDEAVAIFFSLSGFLMALLYSNRPVDADNYLVHRFARIYPVYLVAVLFVAVVSVVYADYIQPLHGMAQILRHLAMLGSTGVFWSIPPEIQFYLFFLLLWLWFQNPIRYQWIGVLVAALISIGAYLGFPGPGILLLSKLPYFLFGALAGRLFVVQKTRPDGPLVGIAALALLVFFFLCRSLVPSETTFWGLTSALSATIIVYLAACGNRISEAVLGCRPLVFAGKISFSLYLFHVPIIFLGMRSLTSVLSLELALGLSILFAYLFAWASYTLIEDPSRRFLTGLWKNRRQAVPAAAE
jgi:peptidoglycan/LPS O-acetylase OafA/YrhL